MTEAVENRTFAKIELGDSAALTRTLSEQDIGLFAAASGDLNSHAIHREKKWRGEIGPRGLAVEIGTTHGVLI